jgi:hypothetical protein
MRKGEKCLRDEMSFDKAKLDLAREQSGVESLVDG